MKILIYAGLIILAGSLGLLVACLCAMASDIARRDRQEREELDALLFLARKLKEGE